MYSKGIVMGCLTRDPEQRTIGEKIVCNFTVAAHNSKTDVCFMEVEVWDKRAEFVMKYFKKGKPILVEGIIRLNSWEKDGQKRSKHLIVADKVAFVTMPRDDQEAPKDPRGDTHPSYGMVNPNKAIAEPKSQLEGIFGDDELPF